MDSPSQPAAADPKQTSLAQGAANKEAAVAQAELNRYNQVTPTGTLNWTQSEPLPVFDKDGKPVLGADGKPKTAGQNQWTSVQTLSPDAQHILDQQMGAASTMSDVLNQRSGQVAGIAGQPIASMGTAPNAAGIQAGINANTIDPARQNLAAQQPLAEQYRTSAGQLGSLATDAAKQYGANVAGVAPVPTPDAAYRDQVTEALYSQNASRLDPQWQQAQGDLDAKLAAQGITQGSAAYDRDYMNQQRAKTDAYQTARNNAIAGGTAAQQAQFDMGLKANQQGMANAEAQAATPLNLASSMQGMNQGQQSSVNAGLSGLLAAQTASPSISNSQYGYDNQGRLQSFTDQNTQLNALINQLAAINSGSQINGPSFTQQNTGVSVNPVDVAGITNNAYQGQMNGYNAQVGSNNALIGAGGMLGAAGVKALF
jgi:hypothetical protein